MLKAEYEGRSAYLNVFLLFEYVKIKLAYLTVWF